MGRALAESTRKRIMASLVEEQKRITKVLENHEQDLIEVRLSESAAEHGAEPASAEGGTMAFELEKELSLDQNASDLLARIESAIARMNDDAFGVCDSCGTEIPVARLEAVPYTTRCVDCARRR